MKSIKAVSFIILIFLSSCGGGGSSDALLGPCIIQSSEPVITLDSVVDSLSSIKIAEVTLSNITLNDGPLVTTFLISGSIGMTAVGSTLVCKTPCGFAEHDGLYAFDVGATGHQTIRTVVNAKYSTSTGSCPRIQSAGTHITVSLLPI